MGLTSNTGPYNAAAEHFGADDPVMVKTPRQLYNFSLEFMLNDNVRMEDDSFGRTFTFNRVVSVTMPDFDYGLVPINQYNRIRHVPTRMTPGPCNIVFYDTKDNQFQTMMKAYAGHYFGHPETGAHDLDPVNFSGYNILNSKFAAGEAQPFGAKTITPDSRFYYQQIRIHNKDSAQGGRTTVLYNCMVNTVQHTTFDYAQSGSASYSVSFQAEHVNIGVISSELINAQQAQRQALQSTIPGTVANRGTIVNAIANDPTGQIQEYVGNIPPGTSLQNKDGKSFIVQSDQAPEE